MQREPTPEWTPEFATALEIYFQTVALSGYDINGYPQLTHLENIITESVGEFESKNSLYQMIGAIHAYECKLRSEKIANGNKN